ncbi:redoxin domain-containing protein [Mariniblastus sp.]|nr:redoxin domain-containing protein [Mariniblastus sp.]MDA7923004.1 redoxin domain-containing protein [bacterium]MDA7924200.1 redoxin domain-containing protein [Mariniblastus sp.]MDB4380238.1 redoxin domain-containing protein [Mariniblastus sp.]MDB4396607.1 redoxin domain-containing protein [bacterium]
MNIFNKSITAFLATAIFVIPMGIRHSLAQEDSAAPKFTIGSKAPDLDIEFWISDNFGLLPHTTKIEKGNIYVIEFWATWCGPCIAAMPHISELQEKYSADNVQIISVSDEDLDTVTKFLERPVAGDPVGTTYEELTSNYSLTIDPDKSVFKDYFAAAQRTGIPCAFLIGKTGLVEWIGHPQQLDKPLEKVVSGEWDRDAFAVQFKKMEAENKRKAMLSQKLNRAMRGIGEQMRSGNPEKALQLIDDLIDDAQFKPMKKQLSMSRMGILISGNLDEAPRELEKFTNQNKNDAGALNSMAWGIYEKHEKRSDVSSGILKQAKKTAEAAVKADPNNGAILDTLAHFIYVVDGNLDKAIEVQQKAVANGGPQKEQLQTFLKQLKEEKKTGKKPKKSKQTFDF